MAVKEKRLVKKYVFKELALGNV